MRHRPVRLPGPEGGRRHRDLRAAGDTTHVAALEVDLHLPHCHSLKEKRAVVKSILHGAHRRYGVAAAEVADQDKWQRAGLGFTTVSGRAGHADEVLQKVDRFVRSFPEVEVIESYWGVDA